MVISMFEDVKRELYVLIKEIDAICRKYDITYYAEGGSAIGALRHHGVIPWDDDMDIVMTRDNYYKFLDAFKKENPKNRALECPDTNDKLPNVTVKYMNTDTTAIFRTLFLDDYVGGLCIDIFVLDPIPRGKEKWFKKEFLSYCEILNPVYVVNDAEGRNFRYKMDLLKCKLFGKKRVLNKYRKKLFTCKEEDCDEYLIRWGIAYQTVNKEYYGKPRYYDFDGKMKIPVPSKAERILSGYFGEGWFILPDAEEQVSHDLLRNVDRPYKIYQDDYLRFVDKKRIKKDFLKAKKLRMGSLNGMRKYNKNVSDLNFVHDSLIVDRIESNKVVSAYKEHDYLKVVELSKDYMNLQRKGMHRRNGNIFNADHEFIEAVLYSYIMVGEYYKSVELFRIVNKKYHFTNIEILLNKIMDIRDLCYIEEYDKALEEVEVLLENNKNNCSLYKIKLDCIINKKLDKNDIDKYIDEIKDLFKSTNDYELYKYLGDLYKMKKDDKKSNECYDLFKENSRNGLLLLNL